MGQDQSALKAQEAELTKTFGSYVDESKYDYLPEPSEMDWLSNIHENGQSLFTYLKRYHNVPDSSRNTLYLIAVDNIDDMSSSEFYDNHHEIVVHTTTERKTFTTGRFRFVGHSSSKSEGVSIPNVFSGRF